ncbi:glycosyltransferase family 4 protein [Acidomonas methanolica]|uniref:Undecaprenyl-phosphate alpha-N-acetylglucosaminephosphotransferase n=1 Tax=Acidomonas methanolica NBRC 104435 TaxID=1231351 RepID=A0A023D3W4_ACIMT|nr:hypothetical protein [Acidomonas methanolica]MBU2653682.1 UDP-phosphate alpha N-acetylglucosaminyltransferase [Acidomonas methanolica]TCS31634.1 UDP-N-acetylmuramyl pentapeptide phosphotransferase/UDP-N-acetylglucosamine-1-phosphate transferase [Acidomonas methanolica]GAJ28848.1 undecaprenyl-phosphate alpha-N-acetylglucosaminephosphotransferase [Acidomonas methanolica NBRC 104435]GEK98052.1 undecaprenyl-phosphate alpha-N-acetylglucosaminyl 1-phosphate transferase [Acidomonas methanolica NBRC
MLWPIFSLVATTLISAFLVRVMMQMRVMDVPGHRSSHTRPVPKGGGVGIVGGFLFGVPALTLAVGLPFPTMQTLCLMLGMLLLAAFSWADDIHPFPPSTKLVIQIVAAVIILAGAGWIDTRSTQGITALLGLGLSLGLGLGWMIFVTNALNFIDGINGLSSGTMALTALALNMALTASDSAAAGLAPMVLAASLLGFIPFNYPRASIFMGDVGSQAAGLALAWFSLDSFARLPVPLLAPLMLSAVLFDVAFTLGRRGLAGQKLTEAHRGHLYQLAIRSGWPAWSVTLLYWGLAVWGGIVAALAASWTTEVLCVLPPLIAWSVVVIRRARRLVPTPW